LDVAECFVNLSDAYAKQNLWPEALDMLEDALAIQQDKLAPSDRRIGETLGKMGSVAAHIAGRLDDAINYHDGSINAVLETHGADDSSLIPSYFSMGKIHRELGDNTNAMISFERALACIVKIGHPGEKDVLMLMAQTAAASGQQRQAVVYLKRCHAFLCKTMGRDAPETLQILATVSSIEGSLA
jgi:tetratricopeptide (TPR) repeat protein